MRELLATTIQAALEYLPRMPVDCAFFNHPLQRIDENFRIARRAQRVRGIPEGVVLPLIEGLADHIADQAYGCARLLDAFAGRMNFLIRWRPMRQLHKGGGDLSADCRTHGFWLEARWCELAPALAGCPSGPQRICAPGRSDG